MKRASRRNGVKKYDGMPLEATWDDIYDMQMSATEMLSGKGSYGDLAEKYLAFARGFVERERVTSMPTSAAGI